MEAGFGARVKRESKQRSDNALRSVEHFPVNLQ